MKKLALKLEDLCVWSFDTSLERRKARGTVHGNEPGDDLAAYPYNGFDFEDGSGFPACTTLEIDICPPKFPPPAPSYYMTCPQNKTCNSWEAD